MLFIVSGRDHDNGLQHRLAVRPKHRAHYVALGEDLILSGPYLDDKGDPIGSMIIIRRASQAAAEAYAAADPFVKGFRRVLHVVPDAVSEGALFRENVRRIAGSGLTFDLCVLPRQMKQAIALVDLAPDVQFVLDHCGVPDIKGGVEHPWRGVDEHHIETRLHVRRVVAAPASQLQDRPDGPAGRRLQGVSEERGLFRVIRRRRHQRPPFGEMRVEYRAHVGLSCQLSALSAVS